MALITEDIEKIEKEIRETPYHKATEHHIGKLRARIARLKDKELERSTRRRQGSGGASGFALRKQGDATVVLIGPPSSGKSTLLNKLTNAESKVAPYAFTTVSVIPGMMKYRDAYIQILDMPGLIEGASIGKGKGKEVLSVARGSDLLLVISDIARSNLFRSLTSELEKSGIRINKGKPKIKIDKKLDGGLIIKTNIRQELDKETIKNVAREFGIKNAEITLNEKIILETLIDSFSQNRIYIPALFALNKIDLVKKKPGIERAIFISAETGFGLEELREEIWKKLKYVRIYLVRKDEEPSLDNPMVVKEGDSLKDIALKIGDEFAQDKSLAKIWGQGAKFPGQEVSLQTIVKEKMMIRFL